MKILMVDDDAGVLFAARKMLEGFSVETESDPRRALASLRQDPADVLIVDYRMPEMDGLSLLAEAAQAPGPQYRILLTAYADKEMLEEGINRGLVQRVIEKPVATDVLRAAVRDAVAWCENEQGKAEGLALLKANYEELRRDLDGIRIIGSEGGLAGVMEKLRLAARHPVPILLTGETGTGKELLARAVHALGPRREGPFVKVNCAAIPAQLMESEFFGHVKGAFTDARGERIGKIELAHGGTLFLDEIGEMQVDLQAKLLGVLQDGVVTRLGGNQSRRSDFRLVAATNRDLEAACREKSFREDLLYRINTFPIQMPPLRERVEDIPDLVDFFLESFCREMGLPVPRLRADVPAFLRRYSWPGNVRELENAVKRVVIIAGTTGEIKPADFAFLNPQGGGGDDLDGILRALIDRLLEEKLSLAAIEDRLLELLVARFDNNVAQAARESGISRSTFFRRRGRDEA